MKTCAPMFSVSPLLSLLCLCLPLCRTAEATPGGTSLPSLVPDMIYPILDNGAQGFDVPLVFHAVNFANPNAPLPAQMSADFVATLSGVTVGSGAFSLSSFHNQSFSFAHLTYSQATASPTVLVSCSNLVNLASAGGAINVSFTPRTLTVSGGTMTEGNAGTPVLPFTVSIEKAIDENLTFSYISSGGTATAGLDYTPVTGTGTIPAGQTSVVINVSVKPDALVEQDETLGLDIGSLNLTVLRGTETTGTIKDDDIPPPPGPGPVATSVTETSGTGTTQAWFAVDLPAARTENVTCRVSTRDGTATAGTDYHALTPTDLVFYAGQTRRWVAITVTATPGAENAEQFYLDVEDSVTHITRSAACTIERFAVTALTALQDGTFQVHFPTGLGQRYFVEEAGDPNGTWGPSSALIIGTGLPLDQIVYPTQSRRFFRVREHNPVAPGTAALSS